MWEDKSLNWFPEPKGEYNQFLLDSFLPSLLGELPLYGQLSPKVYSGKKTKKNIGMKIDCRRLRSPYPIHRVTWLSLSCITFTVGQFITFNVKMYQIYGWVNYYI